MTSITSDCVVIMKTSPAPAFFKFLHIILICGLLISQVAPAIASSTPNFASKTLSKAPAVKFSPSIHPAPTPHTEPADGTPDTKHNLLSALGNLGARTNTNPETGLLIFIGLDPQRPLSLSNLLSPGASPQQASQAFLLKYGTLFGIQDPDAQLVLQKTDQDGGGFQYFRYAQFFQHVPVFGGEMLVQIDSQNNFVSATGVVVPNLVNLNLTPRLNSEAAQNAARQALRAEIESAGKYSMTSDQLVPSTPQQVIFNPELLHAPGLPIPTLAWVVDVQSNLAGTPGEQIILDAQTGTVLMRSPLQQSANVFVYNNENKAEFFRLPNQTQVIRSDSTGSSKVSEVNFAYTTMRNILTFFQNQFQWTSADNHDMDIHVTVNYCPESSIADNDCPYPNAYWDPISHQFVFGQRNLTDDLMGHEFTHAVTSYANGLYYYGQSGSIHESLSDIFGEIYDQNNGIGNDAANVKWLIGEDRPKRYLLEDPVHRSMQDPPKYKQPDQITDTEYSCKAGFTATDDYGSVHHNNSILNKAAYLMSDGGNFNGQQVSAIGTDKTLQLIFQTELVLPMLADYNV